MAGYGDHAWRRPRCEQVFDQRKLTFRSEGRLQQCDLIAVPRAPRDIARPERFDGYLEAPCRGARPLGEHQIVFDEDQAAGHLPRLAARLSR